MTSTHAAACLALNGALLMLAGLLVGAAIPAVPYPRIMLAAHSAGLPTWEVFRRNRALST
jgi:hypothetical protein